MAESIKYIYQIIDKFTPALRKINEINKIFQAQMSKTRDGLKKFGEKAVNVQNALADIGATAALTLVSKKAMDFEDVMTDVSKAMNDMSDVQLVKFKDYILKTSVALGKLPKNLAQIAVAGGKMGIPVEQMERFINIVSETSVAFDMLEAEAGDKIGSIQTKIGLTVDGTADLLDAVNYLADNTVAKSNDILDVIERTSGALGLIKMPAEFAAGWSAFASQIEVGPELAASRFEMFLEKLKQMPGMLEKLTESPHETLMAVIEQFSKMDPILRQKRIAELFGPEAGRFLQKSIVSMDKLKKTMALVNDETKFSGSMHKEFTKKLNTTSTAMGKVRAIIDVVAITIGDVLNPYIKEAAPYIVKAGFAFRDWAKAHPGIVKIGLALIAIVAVVSSIIIFLGILSASVGVLIPLVSFLFKSLLVPLAKIFMSAMIAIGPMLSAIILLFVGLGAGIYTVWKYWDDLVFYFKKDFAWLNSWIEILSEKFTTLINYPGKLGEKLGKGIKGFFGFGKGIKGFFGFGKEEKGVAAENTIASKSTLNGNITVSAKEGSKVESAGMETNVPGNLGFNLMGAW